MSEQYLVGTGLPAMAAHLKGCGASGSQASSPLQGWQAAALWQALKSRLVAGVVSVSTAFALFPLIRL